MKVVRVHDGFFSMCEWDMSNAFVVDVSLLEIFHFLILQVALEDFEDEPSSTVEASPRHGALLYTRSRETMLMTLPVIVFA
jgi:hypothetical protein